MKIALVQLNTVVGDIAGNTDRVLASAREARDRGADLAVFHEMCLAGYPPKDLVERPHFVAEARAALDRIAAESAGFAGTGVVVGLPLPSRRQGGKGVANAVALVCDGAVVRVQEKVLLPTYDVFDEARYFNPGADVEPVEFKGERLGLSICEDAWNDPELFRHHPYDVDPIALLAQKGATLMVNISASPFSVGKERLRHDIVCSHARRHRVPFMMVNQVGGNDELVFDGASILADGTGVARALLPMFEEAMDVVELENPPPAIDFRPPDEVETTYAALVMGTHDYLHKCGFSAAVVGVSGGIDSAVTLAIAADALGSKHVRAVAMPSPYSSQGSVDDSAALCDNLGVDMDIVPIGVAMKAYDTMLAEALEGTERDVTEENIQARIRGNVLMAYSNKFSSLVLSTGNKSELAVGYCTLYGDMSGGLAVISDVPKLDVYRIAEWLNRDSEVIPRAIIDKPPSAELRPDQKDTDSLPEYEVLDGILDLYVEEGESRDAIVARGYPAATVDWVLAAVRRNEYKRRQAAPGIKVTSKAFGVGRRFPIAARYDV
jgi:NAD+ synthase (glutamine-hydrolysing)